MRLAGALIAAAFLIGLLASKLYGTGKMTAPVPLPLPTVQPSPLPVLDNSRAYDVALAGEREWSVEGDQLVRSIAGEVMQSTSIAFLHMPAQSSPLLALDPERNVVWLVVTNAAPSRMIEFDAGTLRALVTVTWPQVVYGAAAVDGYLYLANDLGVAEVSAHTMRPQFVAGLVGAIGPIAVDRVHHRLIALDISNPMGVWSYRHGSLPQEAKLRLPIGQGSVAVADGRIWVGGYGPRGAVLYQLDPRTLQPVSGGRSATFDPGAVVVAAGERVVWVRAGGSADLLACLDARTGRVEQTFHLTGIGPIASSAGFAVVATDQGVLNLTLGNCQG